MLVGDMKATDLEIGLRLRPGILIQSAHLHLYKLVSSACTLFFSRQDAKLLQGLVFQKHIYGLS